jgi:quercetin dioxygenase-like cupin family protein
MITIDLDSLDLPEEETPEGPLRVGFPLHSAAGTAASAVVAFELPPGASLGLHSDSAEEILLVLEGEAEATIGDERAELGRNGLAVVPAMVPHDVRNRGTGPLRVLGFFAAAAVVSTFREPPGPNAPQIFVHGAAIELAGSPPDPSTLFA